MFDALYFLGMALPSTKSMEATNKCLHAAQFELDLVVRA